MINTKLMDGIQRGRPTTIYLKRSNIKPSYSYFITRTIIGRFFILFCVILLLIHSSVSRSEPDTKDVPSVDNLYERVCKKQPNSPLCTSKLRFQAMERIAQEKNIPLGLMLGIANAESSLGLNFSKTDCAGYNNYFGLKGFKQDNGKTDWYKGKKGIGDEKGCWLYKFETLEESFVALANTISMGYKTCENRPECIAYSYVGDPNKMEQSWVDRVKEFY